MVTSREIRLKSRPVGMPSAENFELATVTVPAPTPGEVQVKNIWMTVDPYMSAAWSIKRRDNARSRCRTASRGSDFAFRRDLDVTRLRPTQIGGNLPK